MSKNVTLTWKDPPVLTAVEIGMRVQGAPDYTALPLVAKGVQTLLVPDLGDGVYEFRAVALNGSKRGPEVAGTATVEPDTPGAVTEFTVIVG